METTNTIHDPKAEKTFDQFRLESAAYMAVTFYELAIREYSDYEDRGRFEDDFGRYEITDVIWEIVEYLKQPVYGLRQARKMAQNDVADRLIKAGIIPK